jgi:UDP-N-acetylmuramyl pentapeptide phosphotransferase/UDP-N-acetylglucosamine-1-phosphate transferase
LATKVSRKLGILDCPREGKIHTKETPLAGGISIFLAFHLVWWLSYTLQTGHSFESINSIPQALFLLASSFLVIVGLLDDVRGLSAWIKLSGQTAASVLLVAGGARLSTSLGIFIPIGLDIGLSIFFLLSFINAFNLIDGLDGLATGIGGLVALSLGGVLLLLGSLECAVLCFILSGACLGFLKYNLHPAKVFLGDTGSMFLGFTLSGICLFNAPQQSSTLCICSLIILSAVPLFDTMLAIWRRSCRRLLSIWQKSLAAGAKGIMTGDLEHVHHRLVESGVSQRNTSASLWLVTALLGFLCVIAASAESFAFELLALTACTALTIGLAVLARREIQSTREILFYSLIHQRSDSLALIVTTMVDIAALSSCLVVSLLIGQFAQIEYGAIAQQSISRLVTVCCSLIALSLLVGILPNHRIKDEHKSIITTMTESLLALGMLALLTTANAMNGLSDLEMQTLLFVALSTTYFSVAKAYSSKVESKERKMELPSGVRRRKYAIRPTPKEFSRSNLDSTRSSIPSDQLA